MYLSILICIVFKFEKFFWFNAVIFFIYHYVCSIGLYSLNLSDLLGSDYSFTFKINFYCKRGLA